MALTTTAFASREGPFLDEPHVDTAEPRIDSAEPPVFEGAVPACSNGFLHHGVQVPDMPKILVRAVLPHAWGTQELVDTLVDVAQEMAWLLPDADPLYIGDMSMQSGGPLGSHKMHRDGLDADVGLYFGDHQQPLGGFQDVRPSDLDTEATWLEIRSFLATGRVQFILLDQSLINTLRGYLLSNQILPKSEVDHIFPSYTADAWTKSGFVMHAPDHRNHMHIHVGCTTDPTPRPDAPFAVPPPVSKPS